QERLKVKLSPTEETGTFPRHGLSNGSLRIWSPLPSGPTAVPSMTEVSNIRFFHTTGPNNGSYSLSWLNELAITKAMHSRPSFLSSHRAL
ncbi:hypothetical protein, partial [Deinococcus radiodurans]|uniref:hypothetical protein n=1 Tax=Deinococcus radiodurans TaxID=1299 RepID=UPI001B805639